MIKFFRHIRKALLAENKFSKYLMYAIGEIVLVMIGILLAFQVNSWQAKRTRNTKEISYLKDIRINLYDDIKTIESLINFNAKKAVTSDSLFKTLERYTDPKIYMPTVLRYMYTLTEYEVFEPNRIAFDNMISSENIDLITDGDLRTRLSQYYKKDFKSTTQESVKERTRQFGDYVAIVSFNKQSVRYLVNYNSSLMDISKVSMHQDSKVYAYLFSMLMSTESQSRYLSEVKNELQQVIGLIDQQIQ